MQCKRPHNVWPLCFRLLLISGGNYVREPLAGGVLAAASSCVVRIAAAQFIFGLGWEERIHGEIHLTEQIAGIVACCVGAVFHRYAEIVDRYENLNVTDQLYNGEDTQCDEYRFAVVGIDEAAAKHIRDAVWDGIAIAVAAAFVFVLMAIAGIDGAYVKNNGFGYLAFAHRHVVGRLQLYVVGCVAEFTAEHFDIAFAAEKNDLFLEDADAANIGRRTIAAGLRFEFYLKEEG